MQRDDQARRSRSRCTTTCPRASSACPDVVRRHRQRAVLPAEGRRVDVLRYWFPQDGKGMVDNDLMVLLGRRREPGRRPPLHQLHARRRGRAEELRLHRLPAAAARIDPERARRRRLRAAEPRDRGGREEASATATGCSSCHRRRRRWHQSGRSSRPVADGDTRRDRRSRPGAGPDARPLDVARCSARSGPPGIAWLLLLFVAPLYVVLAIMFGQIDPILRRPVPVWNPVEWNTIQFRLVLEPHLRRRRLLRPGPPADRRLRAHREHAVPAHRLPGRLLHRPVRRAAGRGCS